MKLPNPSRRSATLAALAACTVTAALALPSIAAAAPPAPPAPPAAPAPQTAAASTQAVPADTANCVAPSLTQSFLSFSDTNWYTFAPGESADNFAATGWTLSGGASIVTTTLADGTTGQVLDLPAGATAISPLVCITADYPEARTMIRDVSGPPGLQYGVGASTTSVNATGQVPGTPTTWSLSPPLNLHPSNTSGWQTVYFAFANTSKNSEYQIYNLGIDPRCM